MSAGISGSTLIGITAGVIITTGVVVGAAVVYTRVASNLATTQETSAAPQNQSPAATNTGLVNTTISSGSSMLTNTTSNSATYASPSTGTTTNNNTSSSTTNNTPCTGVGTANLTGDYGGVTDDQDTVQASGGSQTWNVSRIGDFVTNDIVIITQNADQYGVSTMIGNITTVDSVNKTLTVNAYDLGQYGNYMVVPYAGGWVFALLAKANAVCTSKVQNLYISIDSSSGLQIGWDALDTARSYNLMWSDNDTGAQFSANVPAQSSAVSYDIYVGNTLVLNHTYTFNVSCVTDYYMGETASIVGTMTPPNN